MKRKKKKKIKIEKKASIVVSGILCAVGVIILAHIFCGAPKASVIDYTQKPDKGSQRMSFESHISKYQPDVVLVGNSMLTFGVNPRALSYFTQTKCARLSRGGSASAWWYLVIKNIICQTKQKPKIVVVFFRDEFLTQPSYRVTANYEQIICDMANGTEPLVDRLAYLNNLNGVALSMYKFSSLFQQRKELKKSIDGTIKKRIVPALLGIEGDKKEEAARNAIARVFANKKLNNKLLTFSQKAAESIDNKDSFDEQVNKSFLPHMIALTNENNIKMVFVRVKRRRDLKPDAEPEKLKEYITQLRDYLETNDTVFLDFTHDKRIRLDHYADGDHLNKNKGIKVFTKILAEKMAPLIKG